MEFITRTKKIEAFQYNGQFKSQEDDCKYTVPQWALDAYMDGTLYVEPLGDEPAALFIKNPETTSLVQLGDYIIKGDNGDLYRENHKIFEQLYERTW